MDDPDLASAVMQAMPPLDYDQFATKTDLLACTRARDHLWVGWSGKPSRFVGAAR